MNENQESSTGFFRRLGRGTRAGLASLGYGWYALRLRLRNRIRRWRKARVDYVVLTVGGPLPERSGPRRGFFERRLPLPAEPLSLQQLNARLQAIADADNVRGVVFVFRSFSAGLASLQNFRRAVLRLREAGKETVVYTPYVDLAHYYAASAADRIIIPPGAQFDALGLFTEVTFLKDTLARVGIEAEVIQISPFKTAMDRFGRADMSPEYRAQLEGLLDDLYDTLTADIASARGMDQAALRELIDRAPMTAETARAAGLVDHVAYDDELPALLAEVAHPTPGEEPELESSNRKPSVRLKSYAQARRDMLEKPRRHTRRFIGVISLEGNIMMGPSRTPPINLPIPLLGGQTAGEQTLVGLLRRAERIDDMAAVIFHVDSGGGSALASDLIGRQLAQLAGRKPVLVYMGNVAASGGYYVAAPARYIMSQSTTTTGSIGVITAHISTSKLYEMLSANTVTLARGEHAGLYRDPRPLSAEERSILWQSIVDIYEQFKRTVAQGRGLTVDEVDAIGGGRVWTGRQALARGLVDGHGDFVDAIRQAAALAKLPLDTDEHVSVANLYPKTSAYVIPRPKASEAVDELGRLLTGERLREWTGRPLLLLPYDVRLF